MDGPAEAKNYAYKLLAIEPRTESELLKKLSAKFDINTSNDAVAFLKKRGLIDDMKYAEDRALMERESLKGPDHIREVLKKKGVPDGIIEKILSAGGADVRDMAYRAAQERVRLLRGLPKEKAMKRLYDYLARRGYDMELVESVTKEVTKDLN